MLIAPYDFPVLVVFNESFHHPLFVFTKFIYILLIYWNNVNAHNESDESLYTVSYMML